MISCLSPSQERSNMSSTLSNSKNKSSSLNKGSEKKMRSHETRNFSCLIYSKSRAKSSNETLRRSESASTICRRRETKERERSDERQLPAATSVHTNRGSAPHQTTDDTTSRSCRVSTLATWTRLELGKIKQSKKRRQNDSSDRSQPNVNSVFHSFQRQSKKNYTSSR